MQGCVPVQQYRNFRDGTRYGTVKSAVPVRSLYWYWRHVPCTGTKRLYRYNEWLCTGTKNQGGTGTTYRFCPGTIMCTCVPGHTCVPVPFTFCVPGQFCPGTNNSEMYRDDYFFLYRYKDFNICTEMNLSRYDNEKLCTGTIWTNFFLLPFHINYAF